MILLGQVFLYDKYIRTGDFCMINTLEQAVMYDKKNILGQVGVFLMINILGHAILVRQRHWDSSFLV